jgi:hypothetical protein
VICHTHWDREWYLSFERFQARLIDVVDVLLDLLRDDERWTHFHLDGQTALIDDYIAIRPEREREIRRHVIAGRLSCGPWVSLIDEFLVSGESIIRNLEDGIARAQDLGGATLLGYLPDQFGHVGQMPQLLRHFGIEHAIVWRGVPSDISTTNFAWTSPDGSHVQVLYLPFGYGHGRKLMTESGLFADHLGKEAARLEPFLKDSEPLLVMAGGDHIEPSPSLTDRIDETKQLGTDIKLTSLTEILSTQEVASQTWTGELRSAARANLLPNTYSVRVHQKVARARAENLLERYAEPLVALVPGLGWPKEQFNEAWGLLHLNGAHDSVCGCSSDDVAHAVDRRTEQVQHIGRSIALGALKKLASKVGEKGRLVFNPSPFEREDVPGLGWTVMADPPVPPDPIGLSVRGKDAVLKTEGAEFQFTLEDQGDEGDLYTFSPVGRARGPNKVSASDGRVHFVFDRCAAVVSATSSPGEEFVRLRIEIDNRGRDHRLRFVLRLPHEADTSVAGSVFEIVRRPMLGEGGESEPPTPFWPARGFAMAGDVVFLSEGVFEYELTGPTLAMTLLRCVGTISRYKIATRKVVAGPDVPTPEAQMIGTHEIHLGLMKATGERQLVQAWERYALPLIQVSSPGEGRLPPVGTLLKIETPALSSIRRRRGRVAVTVWNPGDRNEAAQVGNSTVSLAPHRIETVTLDS